jgi:hypothetical protein
MPSLEPVDLGADLDRLPIAPVAVLGAPALGVEALGDPGPVEHRPGLAQGRPDLCPHLAGQGERLAVPLEVLERGVAERQPAPLRVGQALLGRRQEARMLLALPFQLQQRVGSSRRFAAEVPRSHR